MSDEQVKNQMQNDAGAAQEESKTAVEQEPFNDAYIRKKYGFDVSYDSGFLLYQKSDVSDKMIAYILDKGQIDYNQWYKNYLEEMKKHFAKDVKINVVNKDLYTALLEKDTTIAFYSNNSLTFNHFTVSPEHWQDCVQMYMNKGYSKERAEEIVNMLTTNDPSLVPSVAEHEMTHREDHYKYGNQQYDLPPQYMAKLDMLTEIKANMSQAGLALDMYKATGDLKYFAKLTVDTKKLRQTLKENPNMPNMEGYVAKYVYDEWLKKYNKGGSDYSQQACYISNPLRQNYPFWALTENPETLKNYHERSDAMFEYVEGLGDVRQYVNPDFELNDKLKEYLAERNPLTSEVLKEIMTKDAKNAEQVAGNLEALLEKIKQIDADGTRTPEEIEQLDQYIQQVLHPQEQEPELTTQNNNALATAMQRRQSKQR